MSGSGHLSGRAIAKSLTPKGEVIEMLTGIRRRAARLLLTVAVILMMVGAPTVAPAYADCSSGTTSCST